MKNILQCQVKTLSIALKDPDLDDALDNDDDYEQEVDTTRPFQPGAASTPYHGGEQYEMSTTQHE